MCCQHVVFLYNAALHIGATNQLVPMYCNTVLMQTEKKLAKTKYWCRMLTFHCLLVELAIFHQYIGAANTYLIHIMAKVFE
jgi:hypothetical protein